MTQNCGPNSIIYYISKTFVKLVNTRLAVLYLEYLDLYLILQNLEYLDWLKIHFTHWSKVFLQTFRLLFRLNVWVSVPIQWYKNTSGHDTGLLITLSNVAFFLITSIV